MISEKDVNPPACVLMRAFQGHALRLMTKGGRAAEQQYCVLCDNICLKGFHAEKLMLYDYSRGTSLFEDVFL